MTRKRNITHRQEQVYRLRHHSFGGLSPKETAERLGITVTHVGRILKEMKKKVPQLFPILTRRQADVYYLYVFMGLATSEVIKYLGISRENVGVRIKGMRKKGVFIPWRHPPMIQYVAWMHDYQVKQKF